MTTSANTPPVRITSLSDFCEVLPLMLGFQPEESLVMVAVRDRTMAVAARFDLPHSTEGVVEATRMGAELGARHDADQIVLAVFSDDNDPGTWALVDMVRTGLHPVPTEVILTDGEYCFYGPDDAGHLLPATALRDEDQFADRLMFANRSELASHVAGPTTIDTELADALRFAEQFQGELSITQQMSLAHTLVHDYLADLQLLRVEDRVALASLVQEPVVREHVRWMITRAEARDHVSVWSQVVQHAPDRIATGALCLLALSSWLAGDGALQSVCLDRAEKLSPDDEMVRFLNVLQREAVDPRTWDGWSLGE